MFVIGLTGNIASGKSTVSESLKSLGAVIIDADKVAREIVEPGTPGLNKIAECFGRDVLRPDGTLDRKMLGRQVFNKQVELDRLNAVTHPLILENIREKLDKMERAGNIKAAVIDAPLLIETGLHHTVDELWVVTVAPEIQIRRVMERDNLSLEEAEARIAAQMPQEEKARQADVVIDNSGTAEELRVAVENLWRQRLYG